MERFSRQTGRVRKETAAAAGVAGPLWFLMTLALLAVLHGKVDVSGHQRLRFGLLMYVAFFVYGSLPLVFVVGLGRELHRWPM